MALSSVAEVSSVASASVFSSGCSSALFASVVVAIFAITLSATKSANFSISTVSSAIFSRIYIIGSPSLRVSKLVP